ncbi:MAG: hypothetical protein ACRD1I_08280 [Terriglobia bacterium]
MYAGHLAAGLAIRAKEPRAPGWAVLLGAVFVDLLFGIFVVSGIERITMTPGVSPGFSLTYIDWSHSLVMCLIWALLFSLPFWRQGRGVALAVGFAVFSHFLLDLLMHPPDLALWPGSKIHLGLGIWTRFPHGWWWIELAFVAACLAYYLARARRLKTFGGHGVWACVFVILLHIGNSPWLSLTR